VSLIGLVRPYSVLTQRADVHTVESIDEGRTQISWSEHARQFEVANRFGALLLNGIDLDLSPKVSTGFNSLALTTIRDALEVGIESSAQIRRAGIYVPAAAQWLAHATPVIWAFCKSKEGYDGERIWKEWLGGSDGSKPTWTGDDDFSVERWMFWKQQLVKALKLEERGGRVMDNVVSHSERAISAMNAAEQDSASHIV
jgi:hypothetical protein